jgi:DNA primase
VKELIEKIKRKADLVEVVSEYVDLSQSGDNFSGFCPFHPNKDTPAFCVFRKRNNWHCFGCEAHGDVISFISLIEGLPFIESVKFLADKYGIPFTRNPEDEARTKRNARLHKLNEEAAEFWHSNLMWDSREVFKYLTVERGLSIKSLEDFKVGYAPNSWTSALNYLTKRGYSQEELVRASLIKPAKAKDTYFDFFRDRITLPIRVNGNILGFGGRKTPSSESKAKFINTRDTPVFKKGNTLFGLKQARKRILRSGVAILVEGYFDVMALHQAEMDNAVSLMGTALTRQQANLLKAAGAKKIILAMDGDPAGLKSSLNIASNYPDLNIYVAEIPSNFDPDDLIIYYRDGLTMLKRIVGEAVPQITFLINKLDVPDDAVGKGKLSKKIMPIIKKVDNVAEQAAYIEQLAQKLGIKNYRPNPTCKHCGKAHYTNEEQESFRNGN